LQGGVLQCLEYSRLWLGPTNISEKTVCS
jgi:hypothetical protein